MTESEYQIWRATKVGKTAGGEEYGQVNLPKTLPYAQTAGQTYYLGNQDTQGLQNKVGALISNPSKRDIPANLLPDFYQGKISYEDLQSQISGSPTFQAGGPQIDYGQGKQSLTPEQKTALASGKNITEVANMIPYQPAVITSQASRDTYAKNQATITSGMANLPTTLYDYYQGQGKTLPSVGERAPLYDKLIRKGNMALAPYTGLESQNNQLLQALNAQGGGGQGAGETNAPGGQTGANTGTPAPILNIKGSNAAAQAKIDQINALIAQGKTSPEIQALVSQVVSLNNQMTTVLDDGTKAGTNGDVKGVNDAATGVKTLQEKIDAALSEITARFKPAQDALLASQMRSPEEKTIQAEVDKFEMQFAEAIDSIENRPIMEQFNIGESARFTKLAMMREANLLKRLGIAQDDRQDKEKQAQGKLDFQMSNYDTAVKVVSAMQDREDKLYERSRQYNTDQLNALAKITELGAKLDIDDPNNKEAKTALQKMALQFGINADDALDFARGGWDETVIKRTKEAADLKYVQSQTNKNNASGNGTGDGLTPAQRLAYQNQVEDNLRANPAVKAFGELVSFGIPEVIESFNSGLSDNISDIVLMRSLAKITDPTTGVKEEEYRTFEGAQGALGQVYKLPSKWIGKGSLTTEGRTAMIREIKSRFDGRATDYNEQYKYYEKQAGKTGGTIPPAYTSSTGMSVEDTDQINDIYENFNPADFFKSNK